MRPSLIATVFAVALTLGHSAEAAIISSFAGVGAGSSTTALDPLANAHLSAAPVITSIAPGNDDVVSPAVNPNTVGVSLDVYAMDPGSSFSLAFMTSDDGTPAEDGSTEYRFFVTLTNALNANGIDPGDAGKEWHGLDVALTLGGAAVGGFDAPPLAGNPPPVVMGGGPFPLQPAGIIPAGPGVGNLRYGGLSGGGGGHSFGTTATYEFSFDLADLTTGAASGPGFLTLTFTANPEPTTIALAGLALIPGGIALRRRRKKLAEADAEEAAEPV